MIFCEKCFADMEIKRIIKAHDMLGDCPCCGEKNTYIYDTEEDVYISELFQNFVSIFEPHNNTCDGTLSFIDELMRNWNFFNMDGKNNLTKTKIEGILNSLCDNAELFGSESVCIPKLKDVKFIAENSILRQGNWKNFSESIKYKNRFHTNLINTDILKKYFTFLLCNHKYGSVFYRARIGPDDNGFDIKDMLCPPSKKASSGRANLEGISRLYLADSKSTAIHEIRASVHDYVTIAEIQLNRDVKLVNFGQINSISPFLFEDIEEVVSFALNKSYLYCIDEEMKRPLSKNDTSLLYIPMQYIADFIYSLSPEYDGIEYDSTVNKGGCNIMIFDSSLCDCKKAETVRITGIKYEY